MRIRWMLLIVIAAVVPIAGLMTSKPLSAQEMVKETAEFKIMVPKGWMFYNTGAAAVMVFDISFSCRVTAIKEGLGFTEQGVEAAMQHIVKQYNGSGPERVTIDGLSFLKTTYDEDSQHKTLYMCAKDRARFQIILEGKDHETDPATQAVFKSIKVK